MTATDGRDAVAAAGFGAAMAVVLGPVGVFIAAMAVGVERALAGDAGVRASGERMGWSVADRRAWLAQDAARQREWRAARRKWWNDGADPATRPQQPSTAARAGAWLRRAHARTVVAGSDFRSGFRDGWRAADELRRDGGGFRGVITVRPAPPATVEPQTPAVPEPKPVAPRVPDRESEPPPQPRPAAEPADPAPINKTNANGKQPTKGTDVTATATRGETNLDLTVLDLSKIRTELNAIDEDVDRLAQRRATLEALITAASERATATGATAATSAALDAATAVAAQLRQHLGGFSEAASEATEQTSAAEVGLRPAQDAQDQLHSAGARGEFVDTATSD